MLVWMFSTSQVHDKLEIYDGDSAAATKITELHGAMVPSPVLAPSGNMFILFSTDTSIRKQVPYYPLA